MKWASHMVRRFVTLALVTVLAGCSSSSPNDPFQKEDELRTTYGDLFSTLEGADLDRWMAVRSALRDGFDQICGDTFCEGDYANLSHVQLSCSSTSVARKMKDCTWVFGASLEYVDRATGEITNDERIFTCKIPVAGTAQEMLDTLSAAGDRALQAPLPGTGKSFYEGLGDCFDGIVSSPAPTTGAGPHEDLGDSADHTWWEMKHRLNEGFDQVCGDSFCEGEFGDITPLGFACSYNTQTEDVSHCTWTFAAANLEVDAKGELDATTMTKSCKVAVNAKARALQEALSGEDPLRARLPGKTSSVYDALVDCL